MNINELVPGAMYNVRIVGGKRGVNRIFKWVTERQTWAGPVKVAAFTSRVSVLTEANQTGPKSITLRLPPGSRLPATDLTVLPVDIQYAVLVKEPNRSLKSVGMASGEGT